MRVERSDKTCKDCGTQLLYHNPTQVYGCEECEKAWSMEQLDDWSHADEMPDAGFDYSKRFE